MKLPICLPYIHTPDNGLELKYSLRSLKNAQNFNDEVYIFGDKEDWFNNINHYPVRRTHGKPYLDQIYKMRLACQLEELPEYFIASMDDIYLTEPLKIGIYYRGELNTSYADFYQRTKKFTADKLISMGLPTVDYETHAPMLVNKKNLLETLDIILKDKQKHNLQWRSMYGNMWNIGGELFIDLKTKTNELKNGKIISSSFYVEELKSLFPDKSEFEE